MPFHIFEGEVSKRDALRLSDFIGELEEQHRHIVATVTNSVEELLKKDIEHRLKKLRLYVEENDPMLGERLKEVGAANIHIREALIAREEHFGWEKGKLSDYFKTKLPQLPPPAENPSDAKNEEPKENVGSLTEKCQESLINRCIRALGINEVRRRLRAHA